MAINKYMRAALKTLSYADIDIKNNYKIVRQLENAAHMDVTKPFYKTWDHTVTRGDHVIPVRIFSPDETLRDFPILLFFHGGGWVIGNIDSYNKVCRTMAKLTKHIVVSVDYRLAPEHRYPNGLLDCYEVAKELFLNSGLLHIRPEQITLIGDSAGANLAAAVSLMARDNGEFFPERQILIYPATYNDHTEHSPFPSVRENGTDYLLTSKRVQDYMELYMNSPKDLTDPYFAPLLSENLKDQPKTLIITAQYDPLRDEGEAYAHRLMKDGNQVELHRIRDALHGFFSLPPRFVQVKRCYQYINQFLSEVETCE